MAESSEVFVGMDVSKDSHAVAVAETIGRAASFTRLFAHSDGE